MKSILLHTEKSDKIFYNHIFDEIENYENEYFDDLHYLLFNQDYFLIGYYNAEQFIKINDLDLFDIIRYCNSMEKEVFGSIHTTFDNAEKLVNNYAYWRGEELLYDLKSFQDFEGERITKELIKEIRQEIDQL